VESPTLIWHQVVQVYQPREECRLTSTRMVKPFHREQLPIDGIVGLVEQGVGHWHPGVFKDRVPARLLVLEPLPHALAVGRPSRGGDMIGKVA
jgi:hypothetical protein